MGKPRVKGQGNIIHSFNARTYKVTWDRACTEGGANELLHLPNPTTRPLFSQLHSTLTWNESPSTYLNYLFHKSQISSPPPLPWKLLQPHSWPLGAVSPLVLGMCLLCLWPASDCLLEDHMKCVCVSTQGTSPSQQGLVVRLGLYEGDVVLVLTFLRRGGNVDCLW